MKLVECPTCNGAGGYDSSRDCEVYDEWNVCPECNGYGQIEVEE